MLENQRELSSLDINDGKTKFLKLVEERSQWEKEVVLLIAKIDVLNENQIGSTKGKIGEIKGFKTDGNMSAKYKDKY